MTVVRARSLAPAVLAVLLGLLLAGAAPGPVRADPADVEPLPADVDVDYQLGGARDVPDFVGVVARDRTDEPLEGAYNICYVNGFQTQDSERRFWRRHWHLVLKNDGRPVVDEAWGEWLLDVRTREKRRELARIVGRWTRGCADDGFDAVEYDNLDSFTRSRHLITRADAVAYARLLVERAHAVGLAAGQKNLAGFDGTTVGYDFAVAEECGRYRECGAYTRVYDDRVIAIEYRRGDFRRTCSSVGDRIAVEMRDRDLSPSSVRRWC